MQSLQKINPIASFLYLSFVIFLGMVITHPAYLFVSVCTSGITAYLLSYKTRKTFMLFLLTGAFFVCVLNPLFSEIGKTVLFTYFYGRKYTLEALLYGAMMALLFITVINWFQCYQNMITSDKFMYIFGAIIPSVSLVLAMVMQFVPMYKNKLVALQTARQSIGMLGQGKGAKQKFMQAATVLNALTAIVLENSITTANSMQSRGFATGKRTSFSLFRIKPKDVIVFVGSSILFVCVLIIYFSGNRVLQFAPVMSIPPANTVGLCLYAVLTGAPIIIIIVEEIKWKYLKLKM